MADVNRGLAKPLFDGLASFSEGRYDDAVDHLLPIRYDMVSDTTLNCRRALKRTEKPVSIADGESTRQQSPKGRPPSGTPTGVDNFCRPCSALCMIPGSRVVGDKVRKSVQRRGAPTGRGEDGGQEPDGPGLPKLPHKKNVLGGSDEGKYMSDTGRRFYSIL
jgi:hypothetical protein